MTNNTESVETTETTENTATNMTEQAATIDQNNEQTYTVSQLGKHFGVSLPTIYRMVDKRLITPINENEKGALKFTKENVNSYIKSINVPEL